MNDLGSQNIENMVHTLKLALKPNHNRSDREKKMASNQISHQFIHATACVMLLSQS